MGQGAEDAGGYEIEYDEYDADSSEGFSLWHGRDGSLYKVNEMSDRHIKNCIRMCNNLSRSANFSCDSEKWDTWVEVFEDVLYYRETPILDRKDNNPVKKSNKKQANGKKLCSSVKKAIADGLLSGVRVSMMCHCGSAYVAKTADLKRGWGLSCSKRCASIRREYGREPASILV